jgi:Fe-S cluster assembly iron-binding protein IscA
MTPTAAQAIRQIAAGSGLEPDPGLRISPGPPTPEGTPLQLGLAGQPEPTDQTVESDGARIYVEGPVADVLDHKVLDAAVDGDQVRFALYDAEQRPDEGT